MLIKDSTIWEEFPEDLEWRVIPDFENYEINNYGDIISYVKDKNNPKYLSPSLSGDKRYLVISLYKNRKPHIFYIHRLVLLAFKGPCPFGLECRHKDGNRLNNHISNLIYGTHEENLKDDYDNGNRSNLSFEQVIRIRELNKEGASYKKLAKQFKVTPGSVALICRYERRVNI